MNWTTEKPTAPGWYWYRSGLGDEGDWEQSKPIVIEISFFCNRDTLRAFMSSSDCVYYLEDAHGEFAGPIPEPEDPIDFEKLAKAYCDREHPLFWDHIERNALLQLRRENEEPSAWVERMYDLWQDAMGEP